MKLDEPIPISRDELPDRILRVLSRGGWANADVLLVAGPDATVVVKDYAPRSWLVRATIGRWLSRRETSVYRQLTGIPAVPRLLGRVDRCAFAIEYRPGLPLSRSLRDRLPREFMAELESGVRAMHSRGVIHLDLRHRSNVLAGPDGHPVLIDFASAIVVRRTHALGRWLIRWVGALDLRALEKWRTRIEGQPDGGAGGTIAPDSSA